MSRFDAAVIGGGVNGLAAAATLARGGLDVVLLERRASPGGVHALEERFPGCAVPAGLHGFGRLLPRVAAAVGLSQNGLARRDAVQDLVVASREQRHRRLSTHPEWMLRQLQPDSAEDARRYPGFASTFARFAEVFRGLLELPSFEGALPGREDFWQMLRTGTKFRGLGAKDGYEFLRAVPLSVADLLHEWFETEWLKVAFASVAVSQAQLGPRSAGSGMRLLHHLTLSQGPVGLPSAQGQCRPGELVLLLETAARRQGVDVRTGADVQRIEVDGERVAGVTLAGGETVEASTVVSALDPVTTLLRFVDARLLGARLRADLQSYRCSGSAAKVHYLVDRVPSLFRTGENMPPACHALLADSLEQLERSNDALKYGRRSDPLVVQLCAPSLAEPDRAAGKYVVSALVESVPHSWQEAPGELGDRVTDLIHAYEPGFAATVQDRDVALPRDLETRFGLHGGHLHHGDLTLDQFFVLRPVPECARAATPIQGLYLGGPSIHPGGPAGGLSGVHAAERVLQHRKHR